MIGANMADMCLAMTSLYEKGVVMDQRVSVLDHFYREDLKRKYGKFYNNCNLIDK